MTKEDIKFNESLVFEGMTSIRAIIKSRELNISDRKIKKILFDQEKLKKISKELGYLKAVSYELGFEIEKTDAFRRKTPILKLQKGSLGMLSAGGTPSLDRYIFFTHVCSQSKSM